MYEYMRTRGGLGEFQWRSQSCSGGNGVTMGSGEKACVPDGESSRATSRGCVPVSPQTPCSAGEANSTGLIYCCPERSKVRELQQAIISAGCDLPQYGVDGLWGTETARGAQCLIERDGWSSVSSRFRVVQGLVQPPSNGGSTQAPSLVGSTRLITQQSYDGLGMWGYVGFGAAMLVLGFAISQMMKKDSGKEEEDLVFEDERMTWRPSMAGAR
jgi:hypothetical protein